MRINTITRTLVNQKLLLAVSLIMMSCTHLKDSDITISNTISSGETPKLVFEQQKEFDQKIDFLKHNNLFTIAEPERISIYRLHDFNLVISIMTPESNMISSQTTGDGAVLVAMTDISVRFYNTRSWKKLNEIKSENFNRFGGISSDGKLLYFDGSLWSTDSFSRIEHFGDEYMPAGFSFSKDGKYFIIGARRRGAVILSFDHGDFFSNNIQDLSDVEFRSDKKYYALYDARYIAKNGCDRAKKIGLYAIGNNNPIAESSFNSGVTCWNTDENNRVLVSLFNGDILLLNDKLAITHKWHINDHIYSCKQGNNNEIWLGGYKSGLYKADLTRLSIKHMLLSSNMISDIKVSEDNKYLGIVENVPGGSTVKIFDLTLSETKSLGPR